MDGFERLQTTKRRTNVHADALCRALYDAQPGVLDSFLTRCQGKMDKAVRAAQVTFVEIEFGRKVTHFSSNLCWIIGSVKTGNFPYTRHPMTELVPDGINTDTQGGDRPESSDHHTSLHALLSLRPSQAGPRVPPR